MVYQNNDRWGFDVGIKFIAYQRKRTALLGLTRHLYGRHSKGGWEEMKTFFKNTCVKCENRRGYIKIEKDHIIPIHDGGTDLINNLQPLCAKCNCSKTNDKTDYRELYCERHGLIMPDKWRAKP